MARQRQPLRDLAPQQVAARPSTTQSKLPRPAKATQRPPSVHDDIATSVHTKHRASKDRFTEKGREYQLQLAHENALREARRERQLAKQQDAQRTVSNRQMEAKIRELRAEGQTQEEIDEFLADPDADEPADDLPNTGPQEELGSEHEPELFPAEFTYQRRYDPPQPTAASKARRHGVTQSDTMSNTLPIVSSPGPTQTNETIPIERSHSSPGPRNRRLSPTEYHSHSQVSPAFPKDIAIQPHKRVHKRQLPDPVVSQSDHDSADDSTPESTREPPENPSKRKCTNNRSGRPKAHDYEGMELSVLKAAQDEFQVRVCTQNAYPDEEEMELWAVECWQNACKAKDQTFQLTERLRKLIIERHSTIRGRVKDKVVLKLVPFYGFKHGSHEDTVEHNKQLATLLLEEDGYVYIDAQKSSGIYDHPILQEVINDQWFNDKKSDGIVFSASFNPIPDPTIALIFTAVEFAIGRWTSGVYVKKGLFSEAAFHQVYERHLSGLEAWRNFSQKSAKSLAQIKQRLHDFGRSNARVPHLRETSKPRFNTAKFARAEAALDNEPDDVD